MCKRRVKVLNSKSPGSHMGSKTPQKAYKHAVQVPFNHVKRVLNIRDTSGIFTMTYMCVCVNINYFFTAREFYIHFKNEREKIYKNFPHSVSRVK